MGQIIDLPRLTQLVRRMKKVFLELALVTTFVGLIFLASLIAAPYIVSFDGVASVVVQSVVIHGFLMIGLSFLYFRDRDLWPRVRRPTRLDGVVTLGTLAVLVIIGFGIAEVADRAFNASYESATSFPDGDVWILVILVAIQLFLVGPGEELLFRGVVQGTLAETVDERIAIVITAVLATAFHATSYSGDPLGVVSALAMVFVMAFVFGYVYMRWCSILVVAAAHGGYNALIVVVYWIG